MTSQDLFSLRGKTVLITGASSGLGAHFASLLAANGAKLVLCARQPDKMGVVADKIAAASGCAPFCLQVDVASETGVEAVFATLAEKGVMIDVMVNNAGIAAAGAALDLPIDSFDAVMATNLRGVWLMATHAARHWQKAGRPGAIVNIASILGERVASSVAPYSASKAAVIQLTKALALEWARHGIRVNALAPGYIATRINDDFFGTAQGAAMLKRIPMRRLGHASELDGAMLLLCSEASSFMTGAVLAVDGGHLVSGL